MGQAYGKRGTYNVATLDSSAAWQSARRVVSANRDVLVAIAGVFYLLPGLIGTLALPKPDMAATESRWLRLSPVLCERSPGPAADLAADADRLSHHAGGHARS
jgi:hypothetical protein